MKVESLEARNMFAAGDLDSTFSGDGRVTTPVTNIGTHGLAIAAQSDGKLVVAGYDYSLDDALGEAHVIRLTSTGALDTSFDGDGRKRVSFGSERKSIVATDVVIQPDGKIVVAGHTALDGSTSTDFFVFRLTASGTLDSSFSGDGKIQIHVRKHDVQPRIALQADGKIVLAGTSATGGDATADVALVRLKSNGTFDTSFSSDGKKTVDTGGSNKFDSVAALTIAPNGKYIVGGSTVASITRDWQINWFHSSGNVYRTKRIVHGGDDELKDLVMTTTGEITAVGYSVQGSTVLAAMTRLTSKGIYDTSFDGTTNGNGRILIDFPSQQVYLTSIELAANGKIVIGGYADVVGDFDMALARVNSNGTLDASFSNDGYQTYNFPGAAPPNDYLEDFAIVNGKVVAVGVTGELTDADLAAIRVLL